MYISTHRNIGQLYGGAPQAIPYDAYGAQNIVLLYTDSCMHVIFGPLRCVRVQIPVTFLFYFVREMICMHAYQRQIRGFLLYSACIQMFPYKSCWCVDFQAKQCGTVCEHCNHDNQSSQMLLVHPRMRLQSSPLNSVYLIMLLISYPKESYQ